MAEQRLLLAGSPSWGYVVPARAILEQLRANGLHDWTLVHRDVVGIERTCGWWWRDVAGGRTEVVVDAVAAASTADACLAFVQDRCERATQVMFAAEDAGLPVVLRFEGRYPYRPGTAHYDGVHPAQLARVARERHEAERARKAARQAARQPYPRRAA